MNEENKDDVTTVVDAPEDNSPFTKLDMEVLKKQSAEVVRPAGLVANDILTLPSYSFKGFLTKLNGMQIKDAFHIPEDTPKAKRYQRLVRHSSRVNSKCDWDDELLQSKSWSQYLMSGEERIGTRNFKIAGSQDVGGEPQAVLVRERLGSGAPRSVPLYASGFYVQIVPSKGTSMSTVMVNILEKAEEIGGRTGGIAYDIGSTFVEQEILDHIFKNIRGSTITDVPISEVRNYIKAPDYRRLIIGQLMANHPTGVIYDQPCVADVTTCQHITTAKLDLNRVLRVATGDFSETQRKHLQRSRVGVSAMDVGKYQESFDYDNVTTLISGEAEDDDKAIRISFQVPSIVDMHTCYTNAINHIANAIPKSLQNEGSATARRKWLDNEFKALPLISHLAWIKTVTIGIEDSESAIVVSDPDTIREVLTDMCDSADDFDGRADIVDGFLEAFTKYMVRIESDVVVKENTPCPNCQGVVLDEDGKALNFIPLEAESLFLAIAQFRQIAQGRLNRYIL